MGPWQYVLSRACRSPDWPTRSSSSNVPSSNPTRAEQSSLTLHLCRAEKSSLTLHFERILEAGHIACAIRHCQGSALRIVSDGFGASSEAGAEEVVGDRIEGDAILGPGEAVSLVGIDRIRHRDLARVHRGDDLVGFLPGHARIVGALSDQQRALDLIDPGYRRARQQELLAIFGARVGN